MRTVAMLAGLALAPFVSAWIGPASSAPKAVSEQNREGGSQVPCAVPLAWRLARVDPEFGVTDAQAMAALESAADLWEDAVGRALFRRDEAGFPVRLVYDERQASMQERDRLAAEVEREGRRLESEQEALGERNRRHERSRSEFTAWQRDLEARVAAHNARARQVAASGDATPDDVERLRTAGDALDRERQALLERREAIERELEVLRQEVERIGREAEEHNRRVDEAARRLPAGSVESGVYRESVRMEGRRVASIGREIRIYRFSGTDELRMVAAHELGHALGLGHSAVADAVMSAEQEGSWARRLGPGLPSADREALRGVCPALFR